MTIAFVLLLMLTPSPHAEVILSAALDDSTKPQGITRRLRESEIATYVVNHGVYPAGIVGEVGEAFRPDGSFAGAGRIPRRGSYTIWNDRLCITVGTLEYCRVLYVDEAGAVFSSLLNADGIETQMFPLESMWARRTR
jgi:hypothetical protein